MYKRQCERWACGGGDGVNVHAVNCKRRNKGLASWFFGIFSRSRPQQGFAKLRQGDPSNSTINRQVAFALACHAVTASRCDLLRPTGGGDFGYVGIVADLATDWRYCWGAVQSLGDFGYRLLAPEL